MKKVKVKLLVNTAYQGPRKEGDEFFVPEDFAERWVKNGIAVYADDSENGNQNDDDDTGVNDAAVDDAGETTNDDAEDAHDYESMNAKDLYALCKEKGIEVEAKKSKEYYIEKLNNA